jgi:hypothetical protein
LIEVVAGLTLLATLAVSVLLTIGAHRRQTQQAEHRLAAADLADRLLAAWYSSSRGVPRNATGPLLDGNTWFWRTRVVDVGRVEQFPVEVVRLQIFRKPAPRQAAITIDLMSPGPQPGGGLPR